MALCLALGGAAVAAHAQANERDQGGVSLPGKAAQLLALANQARRAQGVAPLAWDEALAKAALAHCQMMVAEGEIAHRYRGEAGVTERAGAAGAHFSLIEENVAVASYTELVHQGWMESPEHRANLLNPSVDHVGIAVVAGRGMVYAVADYEKAVVVLSATQVEAAIANLLRARGVRVLPEVATARAACELDHGLPRSLSGPLPLYVMRWQEADLTLLPRALEERLRTGDYARASVGSCAPQGVEGAFTLYRMTVLLYGPPSQEEIKPFY